MIKLGFDGSFVWECFSGSKFYALIPSPVISSAVIMKNKQYSKNELEPILNSSIASLNYSHSELLLFREDSFDPTTRIRRGRFYQISNGNPYQNPEFFSNFNPVTNKLPLYTYDPSYLISIKDLICIGSVDSVWRAVSVDRISTGENLVTLKSRNIFGAIPEINEKKIPETCRKEIISELDHFIDIANRETPGSIVDAARNTAITLIRNFTYISSNDSKILKMDLGELIETLRNNKKELSSYAAGIINRLHPRNKPNERERLKVRHITEEDAELTVCLIGMLLQEFEWAV